MLRRDFAASLAAAYTPGEVRDQLVATELGHLAVQAPTDRHLLVAGRMP